MTIEITFLNQNVSGPSDRGGLQMNLLHFRADRIAVLDNFIPVILVNPSVILIVLSVSPGRRSSLPVCTASL
jgi:hypothetical protein